MSVFRFVNMRWLFINCYACRHKYLSFRVMETEADEHNII